MDIAPLPPQQPTMQPPVGPLAVPSQDFTSAPAPLAPTSTTVPDQPTPMVPPAPLPTATLPQPQVNTDQQDIDDIYEKITLYEKIRESLSDPSIVATLDAEKKALLVSSASALATQLDELGFSMPPINVVQPAGPVNRIADQPAAPELKIER